MPGDRPRCSACGRAVGRRHRFCAWCGVPLAADARPASASLQVGAAHAGRLEEERRLATILFADLSGSTSLAEGLDPEHFREIQSSFFKALARQIQHYEGTVDKYIGDAVMAVFGAPTAHEDDPERAIHCALAMQAEISRENEALEARYHLRLALRIGVNTGEVIAGLISGQSTYAVTGDAVNTAQRLESAAPPGEVLVGQTTFRLARRSFHFEELAPLTLKGKSQPVPAYRVLRPADSSRDPDAPSFVGRTEELERLNSLLFEVAEGRGRAVHVFGEPGVGKSRLLQEFSEKLPAAIDRIQVACLSYESSNAYALVAGLLRAALKVYPGADEATAQASIAAGLKQVGTSAEEATVQLLLEVLGYGARSALDPETKRRLLVAVLTRYLRLRAARLPLILLVEDLHWVDSASASALAAVAEGIEGSRCLLLSTSREPNLHWQGTEIQLLPLDPARAEELVDVAAATPLSGQIRALVLERTGGNPFFIAEVVRSLSAGQAGGVPPTVQEVLAARVDRLQPEVKRAAQRAAVIGREFPVRLLAQISRGTAVEPSLEALAGASLIAESGLIPERTYAFRHALMQEVVYRGLLMAQRRRLHEQVGAAIEHLQAGRLEESVDLLAFHYAHSDNDQKALLWLVRAADRARSLFANEEALAAYRDALPRAHEGEGPLDAGTIQERVGDVLQLTGSYEEAIASFQEARQRMPAPMAGSLARLHRKRAMALRVKGAYDEALEAFAQARHSLGSDRHVEAARAGVEEGALHWRRGDYDAARQALAEAIRVGEELGTDEVVAEGLMQLGNVCFATGLAESVEHYQRARELYERLENLPGVTTARTNLGGAFVRMGRWDDGLREMRESLAAAERIGNPWSVGRCHNNIGEVHLMRDELAPAIEAFQRAIEIWEPIGYASGVAIALIGLGAARAQAGDIEQGRKDLLAARDRFSALGSTTYLPELYRHLASAELAARRLDAAEAAARLSVEYAQKAGARHFEALADRVLGEIAVARGDREGARQLLEASRQELTDLGELAEVSRTEEILSRL